MQVLMTAVAALQEALLPPTLPVLPRARIAARYLAAGQEQAAGGDRFDAVPLPDGRVALCDDGSLECQITDHGRWRTPDPSATGRGHGLMVAGQVVDQLQVSLPLRAGAPPGAGGTVVRLRHRLRRAAAVGPGPSAHISVPLPGPPFTLDIGTDGAIAHARAAGPIDASTAVQLSRRLLTASAGGTLPLTVDLTDVSYLASAGIRALYQVRQQLSAHRQQLRLLAVPGSSVALILDQAHLRHAASIITAPRR
jgi:anti-anti-sigma factor